MFLMNTVIFNNDKLLRACKYEYKHEHILNRNTLNERRCMRIFAS